MKIIPAAILLCGCDGPTAPDLKLQIYAEVHPAVLHAGDPSDTLDIHMFAHNPSMRSLTIETGGPPYLFTSDPTKSGGLTFSYRIGNDASSLNAGPSRDYWRGSVIRFGPRQTWEVRSSVSVADWAGGGWTLTPGRYELRVYFNGQEGDGATFTVN